MIDPTLILEQPALVEANNKKRGKDIDISVAASLLDNRSAVLKGLEAFRAQANEVAGKMASASEDERDALKAQGKELKGQVKEKEAELNVIEDTLAEELAKYPNILAEDVPEGKDESENVVIRSWGDVPTFDFEPKDHLELGMLHDMIDTERAAKVTGARFYYLKGDAARLEFALMQFVLEALTNEQTIKEIAATVGSECPTTPFTPIFVPMMIRPEVYRRMARLTEEDKDERYHLAQDDLYLIGSAEHTLGPMFMDETLAESALPKRFLGFSTSFRREAGSYGKDTRGILRVHQFDKLEMESFTTPEHSRQEQEFFVAVQEYIVQQLKLPYQVMMICTGDIGSPDARQVDINTWIPTQNTYRETHTADLMTDYQSRRLKTRVKMEDGTKAFVHMNDATACAMTRMLIAIMENYQQADGSIVVPEVLRKWMGKDVIGKK